MSFFGATNQTQDPTGYGGVPVQQQMQQPQQVANLQTQNTQPSVDGQISERTEVVPPAQPAVQDSVPTADISIVSEKPRPILPSATKKERFLLIAADQGAGSPNERLNRVIQAKYEAGLLKPYNYVKGYARLSKWMDRK